MVTAFCQWLDVMHLLCLHEPSFLLAQLTKRVCVHVAVTDAFPRTSIFSFGCRVPPILFITLVLQFLMLLTESAVRQPGTAWVGTRPLWFPWHLGTSSGHKESPHRFAPMKAVCILLRYCNDITGWVCHSVPNRANFQSGMIKFCKAAPCMRCTVRSDTFSILDISSQEQLSR